MHSAVEEQGSVFGLLRLLGIVSGWGEWGSVGGRGTQGMWKGASSLVMRASDCGGEWDRLCSGS